MTHDIGFWEQLKKSIWIGFLEWLCTNLYAVPYDPQGRLGWSLGAHATFFVYKKVYNQYSATEELMMSRGPAMY